MKKRIISSLITIMMIFTMLTPAYAEISFVEVNQGLGSYIHKQSGEIKEITSFVAEKNTVILVELDEEVSIDPATQRVEIYKDGKLVVTLSPKGNGKTSLLEFLPKSIDEVNGWLAGSYTIKAYVNGWTMERKAEFKNTQQLNILVVPVKANYGGTVKGCTGLYKTARTFLEQTYPVAEKNIKWVIGPELDCSGIEYDLQTDDGCYYVWEDAKNLQAKDQNGKDVYDLILAFVPDRQGADGTTQGYTYGKPANIITESDEDMEATIAHEIAHCYKVGDEYTGGSFNPSVNDPPYGMEGRDFNTGEGQIIGKNPAFVGDEEIGEGSLIDYRTRPYEFGGRGVIENQTISYMGSGALQASYWTTPVIYEHLYNEFLVDEDKPIYDEDINIVEVYGVINNDMSVDIDPLYTFIGNKYDIENEGDYRFAAKDANGNVLSSNNFEASFYNPSMNETMEYAPFELYGEFPNGTSYFEISKDGKVLSKIPVSKNAPTASFVENPNKFVGIQTFSWEVNDSDGDDVVAQILYSPDGEELYVLEYDYQETEVTYDFEGLEGDENAYMWLVLSDGVNSTNLFTDIENTDGGIVDDEKSAPSSWAVDEINHAIEAGLTYDDILYNYQNNITREEFCKLVVKYYESMGGELPVASTSPFVDTNDKDIIIANKLGIVNGMSAKEFAPNAEITREQIATMMKRAIDILFNTELSDDLTHYKDYSQISSWAIESLSYLNQMGIIKGVSDTQIAPKNNTTREQAILIVYRTFNMEIAVEPESTENDEENIEASDALLEDGVYYIKSAKNPSYSLGISAGSEEAGAKLIVWEHSTKENRKFMVTNYEDGTCTIIPIHSKMPITSDGTKATVIRQQPDESLESQYFTIENKNGSYTIKDYQGFYLGLSEANVKNGTTVILWTAAEDGSQTYFFEKVK